MVRKRNMSICLAAILMLQACGSREETRPSDRPPTARTPAGNSSLSSTTSGAFAPGTKAILDNSHIDLGTVMVAVTEQDLDEYAKAVRAQDLIGAAELSAAGKIFQVPNNTKVLVLESRGAKVNVRLRTGKQAGRACWVIAPSVKPEK